MQSWPAIYLSGFFICKEANSDAAHSVVMGIKGQST